MLFGTCNCTSSAASISRRGLLCAGGAGFVSALIGTLVLLPLSGLAQRPVDPRVADLVQAGTLRFGLGLGVPTLAIRDRSLAMRPAAEQKP